MFYDVASTCTVHTRALLLWLDSQSIAGPQETQMLEVNSCITGYHVYKAMGSNLWRRSMFGEGTQ